jgi:protein-tyrosine phosphatase
MAEFYNTFESQSLITSRDKYNPNRGDVWIGNWTSPFDADFIRDNNIDRIINCSKDLQSNGYIPTTRVPVDDDLSPEEIYNLFYMSNDLIPKIYHHVDELGENILIHCAAGMQRSAAVTAMYLLYSGQVNDYESAISLIRKKRPIAFRPSVNFEWAIIEFYNNLPRSKHSI